MNLIVSIGEGIDKLCILEIKFKKINNEQKKIEIKKEIDTLVNCYKYINKYNYYYKLFLYINEYIWNMTDIIKTYDYNIISDEEKIFFSKISNNIFEFNQKRFRIKNFFNLLCNSDIKEQKSYTESTCKIIINNKNILYNKITEINFLSLEYDFIFFDPIYINEIKLLFIAPNIKYDNDILYKYSINLENFLLSSDIYDIYNQ